MTVNVKKQLEIKIQQAYRFYELGLVDKARQLADELAEEHVQYIWLDTALADLYGRLGYFVSAITFYHKALKGKPDDPILMAGLAKAYIGLGRYPEAKVVLRKALQINDRCVEAIATQASLLLTARSSYPAAIEWLEKAIKLHSTDPSIHTNLPLVLGILGRHEEAMDYAEKALRRFPNSPNVLYAVARTYGAAGQMKDAERVAMKAIQIRPSYGAAYRQLSVGKRFTMDDKRIIEQAETQLCMGGMTPTNKLDFLFALGKMHDDLGNCDKAFSYFQQANALTKVTDKPDNSRHLLRFQKKLLSKMSGIDSSSSLHDVVTPIFIVGMPRSGTSLVEQIIASHPQAEGAGELNEMHQITNALYRLSRKKMLLCIETFSTPDESSWQHHSEEYLAALRAGRERVTYITDKMPANYHSLGLIALMFPHARIVHVIRHPLDVCLSCYFQSFLGLPWSNDLHWVAETYRDYRRIMEEWKKILPEGKIVDIHYEQLIADSETESRRLIEACGLDWDPVCLDYSSNSRDVQTASVWQVRQPIYQTSKMRWVPYAKHLTGLASELSEFLTEDDFKVFDEKGLKVKR